MTHWIVLRTAPQRERWVGHELRRGLGLSTYVPVESVKISNGRKVLERIVPLMRGYCFAGSINCPPLSDIKATRHVHGWLPVVDDPEVPAVITQSEIDHIRELERALNEQRAARPRGVCVGDRVNYKGPFATMNQLLKAIRKDEGLISVPIFGTERDAWVPLADIECVV